MAVPARMSLITLGVADVARATAFYEQLGWKRSSFSVDGDVSFFLTTGTVLALWGRDRLAEDAGLPDSPPARFGGMAFAINLDSEAAVDAAIDEAAQAGGTVVKAAEPTFYGGYAGYFADLDGHLWEVAHNPGFPMRPDGLLDLPG